MTGDATQWAKKEEAEEHSSASATECKKFHLVLEERAAGRLSYWSLFVTSQEGYDARGSV